MRIDGVPDHLVVSPAGVASGALRRLAVETPAEDVELTARVTEALGYVESGFIELLEEAKDSGALPEDFNSAAQAKLLMTGIFGLRVYARMRTPHEVLRGIVISLLSPLKES